jgi:hypothetical protein
VAVKAAVLLNAARLGVTVTNEVAGSAAANALPAGIKANASITIVKTDKTLLMRFIFFLLFGLQNIDRV